jgi:toxin ParE1/3/4
MVRRSGGDLRRRRLIETIEALTEEPSLGRDAEEIRPGYRRQNAGSHVIFYRLATYGIEVVRILHQRMNLTSHFGPE